MISFFVSTEGMASELRAFTEYEEEICFDLDDPDFVATTRSSSGGNNGNTLRANALTCSMEARVPSPMSLAGVHPLDMHENDSSELIYVSSLSSSYGSQSSLEDMHKLLNQYDQVAFTIEDFHRQLNSCFTCGVCWQEEHVSLDCCECGGYSLERPCPVCDGECDNMWKRNLTLTHASGMARWRGECGLERSIPRSQRLIQPLSLSPEGESQLCQRLENLKS